MRSFSKWACIRSERKMESVPLPVNDDILASISEPTTKALVGMLMAENKSSKENSLLKEQTTFTIDMRPIYDLSKIRMSL